MAAGPEEADFRTRYEHLIKPIRDLTDNWNVDIAKDLEEYLEELENVQLTFDDGKTSINFAEAALILQGSAHVYSKKVEYLYSLVMECQKAVISRREQKEKRGGARAEDGDDNADEEYHDEDDFLDLDDIEEGTNIDLPPESAEYIHKYISPMAKMPFSLVKFDDTERGEYPLLSEKGEVIGNRKDFKMNTAVVTDCGAMLLDRTHIRFLEQSLAEAATQTGSGQGTGIDKVIADLQALSTTINSQANTQPPDDVPTSMNMSGADDHDDGGDLPAAGSDDHVEGGEAMEGEGREAMQGEGGDAPQTADLSQMDDNNADSDYISEPEIDRFEDLLDPHEDTTKGEKPMKKCITWRLPSRLKDLQKKRKRNQDATKGGYKLLPMVDFYENTFYPRGYKLPAGCSRDFEHHYWPEHDKRTQMMKVRKERYLQKVQKQLADAKRTRNGKLEATCTELVEDLREKEEAQDEPAGGMVSDDDDYDLPFPLADDAAIDQALAETSRLPWVEGDPGPTDTSPHIQSYEDLVRHHVDLFMRQAQKDSRQTEMTRRVEEWEDKIVPRLEAEESHDPFDIHKSGSTILNFAGMGGQNPAIPFREIVRGCPQYEVCRLFSAALQLANSGNIEIGIEGGESLTVEERVDKMTVRLLSRRRHYEDLADFRAPSAET